MSSIALPASRHIRAGLLQEYWYYSAEIEPDRFTTGMLYGNVALTRGLLRRMDLTGARCIDLGTMEGLVPTLMIKRGASDVVAFDAMNNTEKVDLIKQLHGVSFQYQANTRIDQTAEFMKTKVRLDVGGRDPSDWRVDVTVASGLLYHVAAPLPLFGHLRSVTRSGGLVILETAAINRREFDMRYGYDGERYIYGWSDTWFPSVPLLDHLLRTCRLKPLDVVYLDQNDIYPDLVRLAVVCRAVDDVVESAGETRMAQSALNVDFHVAVDLEGDRGGPEIALARPDHRHPVLRSGMDACDMYATVNAQPGEQPGPDEIRLRLDAMN